MLSITNLISTYENISDRYDESSYEYMDQLDFIAEAFIHDEIYDLDDAPLNIKTGLKASH